MTLCRSITHAAVAGLLATAAPAVAFAQQATPQAFSLQPAAPVAGGLAAGPVSGALATFPGSDEALTFTGEGTRRQFAVYVLPLETTKPARLVLTYQSTVSIMPESSAMRVFVNDLPVGETRLGAGGMETLALDLAPGMLQPGFNQVRLVVDQHHRVDCSIAGTYELWTALDPAKSGISFEGGPSPIQGLEDLPALSRFNLDGVTAVRAALPKVHSAKDVERAMSAIQSAALIGNFTSPKVLFDNNPGGAALEVVTTTLARLPVKDPNLLTGNTSVAAVTFEPATATSAARLLVVGATEEELDRALANLAKTARDQRPSGTGPGLKALVETKGIDLSGGQEVALRDLGMASRQFAGRFYQDQTSFRLPADFYPADYADAGLTLNAAYAAGLASDSQLIVRANGRVVSTIALSSSKPGLIERQELRVPLSALQPGKNTLSFEANLANDSDAACEPAAQANPPARLFISDGSTLSIPTFARVGHVPDLSAMASVGPGKAGGGGNRPLSVLTKSLEAADIGVAATFVAKMAVSAGTTFDTRFINGMPPQGTGDLIGFGTYADLPPDLLQAVRLAAPDSIVGAERPSGLIVAAAKADERAGDWTQLVPGSFANAALGGPELQGAAPTLVGLQSLVQAFSEPQSVMDRIEALAARAANAAGSLVGIGNGAVAADADPATFHRPAGDAALVIAQGQAPATVGAAWTVVAASNADQLVSNVALLTSTDRWDRLGGAVATLHGESETLSTASAGSEHLFETQPRSISNLRLVVAGWFSRHLESYVIALLLSCLVLGVTTFLFLRSVGAQRR